MRRDRKSKIRKERLLMVASSLLVMGALTMTGIYMKGQSQENKDDGYSMDFEELEKEGALDMEADISPEAELRQMPSQDGDTTQWAQNDVTEDDLDYDPLAAGSSLIQIPGLTDRQEKEAGTSQLEWEVTTGKSEAKDEKVENQEKKSDDTKETVEKEDDPQEFEIEWEGEASETLQEETGQELTEAEVSDTIASVEEKQLYFEPEQGLVRPVTGEVLIPYSMDNSVYFATLDQYKYNPAIIFAAVEGENVIACADATVASVYEDAQTGTTVVLELGNGFLATYGQLKNLKVSQGERIDAGDILGSVAAPTRYYSVEGTNLYFALTQHGVSLDPEKMF